VTVSAIDAELGKRVERFADTPNNGGRSIEDKNLLWLDGVSFSTDGFMSPPR
jgi:hypothetical protein